MAKNCDRLNLATSPSQPTLNLRRSISTDGARYIAIFAGQSAELRARDYYDAVDRGALDNRIADAQVVTAKRKPSLSHRNNEGQCAEKAECWRARAGAGMAATLMCGWADEL